MSEFVSELNDRVAKASTSLHDAQDAGDDYLVEVRVGELEELARVAEANDVEVPGLQETIAAHTGPIDVVLPEPVDDSRDHIDLTTGDVDEAARNDSQLPG